MFLRKETQVGSQGRSNEDHFSKSVIKVLPVHSIKAYRGVYIAPLILKFSTR
jgi:hypothetical protein